MLRITKLTDYASVLMTVMAASPTDLHSAAGLAERAGLEPTTVSKVLKLLAQADLLEGVRGAAGGYRLARTPAEVTLKTIVEAMEGPLAMTECSGGSGQCGIQHVCGARANWRRVNDVIADALSAVTLADMLEPTPTPTPTPPPPVSQRDIPLRLASA
jgi:FeS assembly SUF system regulator